MRSFLKPIILSTIVLFFWKAGTAQNLVPNGGFEAPSDCPGNPLAEGGFYVDSAAYWFNPTSAHSEIFRSDCDQGGAPDNLVGVQDPRSGKAFGGLSTFSDTSLNTVRRDYMGTPLQTDLKPHKEYCFSCFFSLADSARFASGRIGFFFLPIASKTPLIQEDYPIFPNYRPPFDRS